MAADVFDFEPAVAWHWRFRKERLRQGKPLHEVARAAGLSAASLSSFEIGRHDLRLRHFLALAAVLGYEVEWRPIPVKDE